MTAFVSDIEWLSTAAQEAVLTVSDGALAVHVFSQPCTLARADQLGEPLLAFNTSEVARTSLAVPYVEVVLAPFAQEFGGVVEDAGAGLIRVGGIAVVLDVPLPGDIAVGEAISFRCARLDCLE